MISSSHYNNSSYHSFYDYQHNLGQKVRGEEYVKCEEITWFGNPGIIAVFFLAAEVFQKMWLFVYCEVFTVKEEVYFMLEFMSFTIHSKLELTLRVIPSSPRHLAWQLL